MKTPVVTNATLLMLAATPALAMSCCGGSKGKAAMCAKGGMKTGMSMSRAEKGKGCCCEGMSSGRMSRRG